MKLMDVGILQSSLFFQLALRTLQGSLIHFQEPTGECPTSLERFNATLYQQDIEFCPVESENHAIRGDTRMRIFVNDTLVLPCLLF